MIITLYTRDLRRRYVEDLVYRNSIDVVFFIFMPTCKELPIYSSLKKASPLYKGIALSLLVHLLVLCIFMTASYLIPEKKMPAPLIIPVKLVSIRMAETPMPVYERSVSPIPVHNASVPIAPLQPLMNKPVAPVIPVPNEDHQEKELVKTTVEKLATKSKFIISVRKKSSPPVVTQPALPVTPVTASAEVSETAAPDLANGGSEIGNSADSEQALRSYEQMIALWFERYKDTIAETRNEGEGKAILRIRIDRHGAIVYYKIEQSTGNNVLDKAVVAMVKNANPLPPIPPQYTAENQVEFLLPISFNAAGNP
jgi:protein TonB